jgi:hypothetical protein
VENKSFYLKRGLILATLPFWFHGADSRAASNSSTTANATATVIASITIVKASDLVFGNASPGDGAKPVAPGSVENAENASFTVSGQPNTAYTITLPASATMATGAGGVNQTIAVSAFTSFPANTGTIGAGGSQLLLVGATRAAIGAAQVAGAYSGSFTVQVAY